MTEGISIRLQVPGTKSEIEFIAGLRTAVGKILASNGIAGYEPETLSAALAIAEALDVSEMADIGANIGIYSLVLGTVRPDMRIKAFEPLPFLNGIFETLSKHNAISVDIRSEALSDSVGQAKFYVSEKSDSSNSLNPNFRHAKSIIDVSVTTLDELFRTKGFEPILIKIDTESTEPDVIAGARTLIKHVRPWIICEVLPGRTEDRIDAFLSESGYLAYPLNGSPDLQPEDLRVKRKSEHRDWLLAPEPIPQVLRECYAKWLRSFSEHVQLLS